MQTSGFMFEPLCYTLIGCVWENSLPQYLLLYYYYYFKTVWLKKVKLVPNTYWINDIFFLVVLVVMIVVMIFGKLGKEEGIWSLPFIYYLFFMGNWRYY